MQNLVSLVATKQNIKSFYISGSFTIDMYIRNKNTFSSYINRWSGIHVHKCMCKIRPRLPRISDVDVPSLAIQQCMYVRKENFMNISIFLSFQNLSLGGKTTHFQVVGFTRPTNQTTEYQADKTPYSTFTPSADQASRIVSISVRDDGIFDAVFGNTFSPYHLYQLNTLKHIPKIARIARWRWIDNWRIALRHTTNSIGWRENLRFHISWTLLYTGT